MKGIYKIINNVNNKYYIGSSNNIDRRWKEHINCLNKNKHINFHLQKAWNKYGESNFSFIIVQEVNCSSKELLELEQNYLDNIDSNCYNLSLFSSGGDNISYHPNKELIIKNISNSIKKRYLNMSKEERDKLSQCKLGYKNPMYNKKHKFCSKIKISNMLKKFYKNHHGYRYNKNFEELFSTSTEIKSPPISTAQFLTGKYCNSVFNNDPI
jgi:group I intron endonuclease